MIDVKTCRKCRYWNAYEGCCDYIGQTGVSRVRLGATEACHVLESKETVKKERKPNKGIRSYNARRAAVKRYFDEGLSDAEIAKKIGYAACTVLSIRTSLGLTRERRTTVKMYTVTDKKTGEVLVSGRSDECAAALGLQAQMLHKIARGYGSRKYIVEVAG